jgi:two-component system OmpR family response regulator/two-component system response regulator QseB
VAADHFAEASTMQTLILDSNAADGAGLAARLGQDGHAATAVTSMEQAWQALLSQRFDVVLLESTVADGNCFQLCMELRQRFGDQLLIMFVSALDTPARRVAGIEIGADDFVGKSCAVEELIARIDAQYRRRRLSPARDRQSAANICRAAQLDRNAS